MTRPTLEVADIIRKAGDGFIERNESHLAWPQLKVLRAIRDCRTAALGGHLDRCSRCGHQAISYNSCRNRHCPKCQTSAREQWLAKQSRDLLPTLYFHVVFTLPHQLSGMVLQNKKTLYDLLFRATAETLMEVAADQQHLGATIGFLSVLHTWGQNLQHHPHIHLRHPRRRPRIRRFTLDSCASAVLSSCSRPEQSVPGKVRGRPQASVPHTEAGISRQAPQSR